MHKPRNILKELYEITDDLQRCIPSDGTILSSKHAESGEAESERLFRMLQHTPNLSDEEAATKLLGIADLDRYKTARSRLRAKLLRSLCVLDIPEVGYSKILRERYRNHQNLLQLRTLEMLGLRRNADAVARKGLEHAVECELWSNAIDFSTYLRSEAMMRGNNFELKKYDKEIERATHIRDAEDQLQRAYQKLRVHLARTSAESPKLIPEAREVAALAEKIGPCYDTYGLGLLRMRATLQYQQTAMRYREAVVTCDSLEALFLKFPKFETNVRRSEFGLHRVYSELHLRNFDAAKSALIEADNYSEEGDATWFLLRKQELQLYLQQEEPVQAAALYQRIANHPKFSLLPEETLELWRLFRLYLLFDRSLPLSETVRSIELSDLASFPPAFSRDKAGLNCSILFLQVLVLMERQNFGAIEERLDAIQKYKRRYLRGRTTSKSYFPIAMLAIVRKENFDYKAIRRRTLKLEGQMKRAPTHLIIENVQVFSEEKLWRLTMAFCKQYGSLYEEAMAAIASAPNSVV